jgi:hypothetical protein
MKLRALQDTYFEAPRKKGDVFDADDVNGRVLVEIIGSCEKVDDMPKQQTKAETPPVPQTPAPVEAPKYEAAAMTTDNVEPLVKRRNYKRRDLRAED